jgi:hypothetical protein
VDGEGKGNKMGLDIYCRWGTVKKNEDGYKYFIGWQEEGGQWNNYYENSITGFESVPESGYLRESWGSLRAVTEMAEKLGAPNPYDFFPDWEGSNGEELMMENGTLENVLSFRDQTLIPWLAQSKEIGRALEDEPYKEFQAFRGRIRDVIGFINFLQVHSDKENLTVIFG